MVSVDRYLEIYAYDNGKRPLKHALILFRFIYVFVYKINTEKIYDYSQSANGLKIYLEIVTELFSVFPAY